MASKHHIFARYIAARKHGWTLCNQTPLGYVMRIERKDLTSRYIFLAVDGTARRW